LFLFISFVFYIKYLNTVLMNCVWLLWWNLCLWKRLFEINKVWFGSHHPII